MPEDVSLEVHRNQHDATQPASTHGRLGRLEIGAASGHGHSLARIEPAGEPATHGRVVPVHHDDRDISQHLMEVGRRVEQAVEHRGDPEHGEHPRIVPDQPECPERGPTERPHSRLQ
jgi:hypothetical protein